MGQLDVVQIDIATRIVGPDEDFFIVRPGKGFSLYREFERRSAVFLDFPDLDLQAFAAAPKGSTLRREIALRSMAIRDWHLNKKLPAPSRDIKHYAGKAFRSRLGHYVSAIERLYFQLPENTIVIVPAPGPYSDVLIGVLEGSPQSYSDFKIYEKETLPGRPVRWLGRRPKALFSPEARERLANPHPLMQLERGLREECEPA